MVVEELFHEDLQVLVRRVVQVRAGGLVEFGQRFVLEHEAAAFNVLLLQLDVQIEIDLGASLDVPAGESSFSFGLEVLRKFDLLVILRKHEMLSLAQSPDRDHLDVLIEI